MVGRWFGGEVRGALEADIYFGGGGNGAGGATDRPPSIMATLIVVGRDNLGGGVGGVGPAVSPRVKCVRVCCNGFAG